MMASTDFSTRCYEQIKEADDIQEQDIEWALNKFKDFLSTSGEGRGDSRKFRYMSDLKTMMKFNDFSFHDWKDDEETREKVRSILAQIERSDYRNGDKEYAPKTKQSYFNTVKRVIESHDIDPENTELLPQNWSPNTSETEASNIRPGDLPSPEEMKKLLRGIEAQSKSSVQLRNTAFFLLLWDTGARFGEADSIEMGSVHVEGKKVTLEIPGNKDSNDRPDLEIFQGRKTLKDWIMQHPDRDNPDAKLFPNMRDSERSLPYNSTKRVMVKARSSKGLDFTIKQQPYHIFRKASTTFYVVNDILSAEKVFDRQGKSVDATLPTYLKMALSDVDASAAEGFGLDGEERSSDGHMKAPPLMPQDCTSCGERNRCYREITELPESEMPKNISEENISEEGLVDMEISAKVGVKAAKNPDKTLNQIKNEVLKP